MRASSKRHYLGEVGKGTHESEGVCKGSIWCWRNRNAAANTSACISKRISQASLFHSFKKCYQKARTYTYVYPSARIIHCMAYYFIFHNILARFCDAPTWNHRIKLPHQLCCMTYGCNDNGARNEEAMKSFFRMQEKIERRFLTLGRACTSTRSCFLSVEFLARWEFPLNWNYQS